MSEKDDDIKRITIMINRLYSYMYDNQQPENLKIKLPKTGQDNVDARVAAGGALLAVVDFALLNYERVDADFLDKTDEGKRVGSLRAQDPKLFDKQFHKYIKDKFLDIELEFNIHHGGGFGVMPGRSIYSDESNREGQNLYVNALRVGYNVQIEELKTIFPKAKSYPAQLVAKTIGDALKLTKLVIDTL